MPEYPKEQLWKLYQDLPKDIQGAIWAEKNADFIHDICVRNKVVKESKISEIAKNITYVLLGLLPPNEFQDVLKKELKLKKAEAEQIALEINRFVFLPVKNSLEGLYDIEIKPGLKPKADSLSSKTAQAKREPKKEDKYRETLE